MQNKFLFVEPQNHLKWISFWKSSLKVNVDFLKSQNIFKYEDLRIFEARALLEPPLWRLLTHNGKYHTRFYSREVWERTLKEGKLPNKHSGTWSAQRAEVMLEHVVERAPMIAWILENPQNVESIENVCLGCVVTKRESKNLLSKQGVSPLNVWKRYLESKIDVYDRMTDSWHILDGILQKS